MKAPTVFVSLLALAGTVATAESANAAVTDLEIPTDLREAICHQNWYQAIELSSRLITSSKIMPEHRQILLDWRRNFYTCAKGDEVNPEEIADCKGLQPADLTQQAHLYQGPTPRFSYRGVSSVVRSSPQQVIAPDSIWAVGTRVEGNSIKGTLLNNGLAAARDVTLTVRSRQDEQSDAVKTVAIDRVNAWSEAEFVATFNHSPGNWLIESIEVN